MQTTTPPLAPQHPGAEPVPLGRLIVSMLQSIRRGDFDVSLPTDLLGIEGEIARELNAVVDVNRRLAVELSRVSTVVGKDGELGQRASLEGALGLWASCIDSVNTLIDDLVQPTTEVGRVIGAVASGDLSQKMKLEIAGRPLKGEFLHNAKVVNGMVEQLSSFAREVTRVAREVGTDGKLGGQANVRGVAGTWKDLTDSVNLMAGNLTAQVRNIAEVTTAVATGDLSKKITVDVRGEVLELKNTINAMVDRLNAFAGEVTRVAREVGTEGKLGGQAEVHGASGTWKDLTDSVNLMAGNLTAQVRNIAEVTTAVAMGNLSKTITVDVRGEILELKNTINTMVDRLNAFASEVTRVAREVGTEGKLGGQARVQGVSGTWADLTDSVNSMASNLTNQVRNIAEVTTAVAMGDLSKKITVDVRGEMLELKNTINTMVDQLNSFAGEVTRVGREVGTEGRLGGQAYVQGAAGTWRDLTDSVNSMASNLTNQVRGIAKVVTAVARGDLTHRLELEARGEIAELAETINSMTATLAIFADQVSTVAREVGVQGKLGGQANVPGVAGTWRGLTDNVNQLAANLTTQVRAIGDVATAVTKGDLTRYITVEASGEVAALKDNINEMIRNLKETTQKTTEQDWLKTNLARFTRMMQGQRDLVSVAQQILSELAPLVMAQYGAFYMTERENGTRLRLLAGYASTDAAQSFRLGEGLVGQCALEKRRISFSGLPLGHIRVRSGLGESAPTCLAILPVLFEQEVNAVIELASFEPLSEVHQVFLDQLTESIGIVINTIAASMRTEALLQQSQSLTQVLQSQQEELRQTNERLERQAATLRESEEKLRFQREELQMTNEQLEEKAKLLELRNREIEYAKGDIEEKAEQLALTSKYKSEFLANMSHELRTPLNSLLILSRMLSENLEGNLTQKQVGFAQTIYASGTELLELINDILDLSKIESGTIAVEPSEVLLSDLRLYVEQNFRHVAQQKGLDFSVEVEAGAGTSIVTDAKRLQQVLRNLLSNAFKFTERGGVTMQVKLAGFGWARDHDILNKASNVVAFAITDTGIGIPEEKQRIIFEAFQQADGTTSRRYGGTGLGLSISREIARLLGGEIRVVSMPGTGSTFTFYLPREWTSTPPASVRSTAGVTPLVDGHGHAEPIAVDTHRALDDRDAVHPGVPSLLIIDDDVNFSRVVVDLAHTQGLKVLVAENGGAGMELAARFRPAVIALDIRLPDCEGWTILDRLKRDPSTRCVPVVVLSAVDERDRAYRLGAAQFVQKSPSTEEIDAAFKDVRRLWATSSRRLLVVDADDEQRRETANLFQADGITISETASFGVALESLERLRFECIVVNLRLPLATTIRFLQDIRQHGGASRIPVVAHGACRLAPYEFHELRQLVTSIVSHGSRARNRLLNEVLLRLHFPVSSLSESQQQLLTELTLDTREFEGHSVLVIDDDVRNIFAITSALERYGTRVVYAESGRHGLELLQTTPGIEAVFTDIMMPEMDGYEVIHCIRQQEQFAHLPVIALTAKAMRGDRDECIRAGASDYIAKPVDIEELVSALRVWILK